jgi:hypothetical protein
MRKELQRFTTLTREFTAIVEKKSVAKEDWHVKTICLIDVKTNKRIVADHCWIFKNEEWKGIAVNCKVSFTATVKPYYKIYKGTEVKDYCLCDIHNVKIVL